MPWWHVRTTDTKSRCTVISNGSAVNCEPQLVLWMHVLQHWRRRRAWVGLTTPSICGIFDKLQPCDACNPATTADTAQQ